MAFRKQRKYPSQVSTEVTPDISPEGDAIKPLLQETQTLIFYHSQHSDEFRNPDDLQLSFMMFCKQQNRRKKCNIA